MPGSEYTRAVKVADERNPLADDLAASLDPTLLARRVGIEPEDWQAKVLRSAHPRILMNAARQSGKSTLAAILAVHQAVYIPGSLTLLLSPSLRQSQELFRKSLLTYRRLGRPIPSEAETTMRLWTPDLSRRGRPIPRSKATTQRNSAVGKAYPQREAPILPLSGHLTAPRWYEWG